MKDSLLIILIFFGCISCNYRRDALQNGSWIIEEGYYNGKRIEFKSTNLLQLANVNGDILISLKFFEDGTITLPGINSSDIRAKWDLIDGKLTLRIDSAEYSSIYDKDLVWKDLNLYMNSDSSNSSGTKEERRIDPLRTSNFEQAMKIYENPFELNFEGDNLILESNSSKIVAVKDRSIDKMFEGL